MKNLLLIFTSALLFVGCSNDKEHKEKELISINESEKIEEELDDNIEKINTNDWLTYRNKEYGFEIKYPKELILEKKKSYASFIADKKFSIISQFARLRRLKLNNFKEDIKIHVNDQYVYNKKIENIYFEKIIDNGQFIGFKSKWKVIPSEPYSKEVFFSYRADFENQENKKSEYGDYKTIIFFELKEEFDEFENIFNQMILTFKSFE
jgi:hypothetical protein